MGLLSKLRAGILWYLNVHAQASTHNGPRRCACPPTADNVGLAKLCINLPMSITLLLQAHPTHGRLVKEGALEGSVGLLKAYIKQQQLEVLASEDEDAAASGVGGSGAGTPVSGAQTRVCMGFRVYMV